MFAVCAFVFCISSVLENLCDMQQTICMINATLILTYLHLYIAYWITP